MLTDIPFFQTLLDSALIIKIVSIIIILVYLIFAIVIFSQIKTMNKIISISSWTTILEIVATIHILAVASLFIYAIVIL